VAWYDKVSSAWNSLEGGTAPAIGGAWQFAKDFAHDEFGGIASAFGQATSAVAYPLNMVQRGTAAATLNNPGNGGNIFSADDWSKAWALTDVHDIGNGQSAEGISTGQVLSGEIGHLFGGKDWDANWRGLNDTPEKADERANYFHNTWSGSLTSGAMDLTFGLVADPMVAISKFAKGVEVEKATVSAGDVDNVIKLSAGDIAAQDVSKKVVQKSGDLDKFLAWTTNKPAAVIATHPALRDNRAGGTIAHLMNQADLGNFGITDYDNALETKRTLMGALLGQKDSIAALQAKKELLANEVAQLTGPPIGSINGSRWNPLTNADELVWESNATDAPEVMKQSALINQELARLNSITVGSSNVIRGTFGAQLAAQGDQAYLRSSTLYTGIGNRPVTVIGGMLRNQLEGNIHVADAVSGGKQLFETLKQAPHLTDDVRIDLMSRWAAAANDSMRGDVVRLAESKILQSTADHYNIPANQIGALMAIGEKRRNAWTSVLKSRLYSAADSDAFIHYIDPETGAITVVSKPILQSQIEKFHPILNPKTVDATLKAGSQNRLFERMMAYVSSDGSVLSGAIDPALQARNVDFASNVYGKIDAFGDLVGAGIGAATKMWKDAMLLPRALAYGTRIQIDSQMRLAAHMGVLNTFAGLQKSIPGLLSYYGSHPLKDPEGALAKALAKQFESNPEFAKWGLNEDGIGQIIHGIVASGGSHADIADELFNKTTEAMRGSGNFGYVEPGDRLWRKGWDRAVIQQIRNSPTAMKMIVDARYLDYSRYELKKWILNNPEGQKEWSEIAPTIGYDVDQWISSLESHLDHYLPATVLKDYALRGAKRSDVDDYFSNVNNQMRIHGESYNPLAKKGGWRQWYDNTRQNLYQLVSDAPETVMARVPLYLHEFSSRLTDMQSRLEQNLGRELTEGELMTIRRTADKDARVAIGNTLFDASHTSNLAHSFKYVAPFFAAWEDMMKKWGTLLYNNPGYGERLRQVWNIPENTGLATDEYGQRIDANGNHYALDHPGTLVTDPSRIGNRDMLTIPLGFLPDGLKKFFGSGDQLRIDKKSFNIIFQGDPWWLPGFGPLVQVPANQIIKNYYPEAADNPVIHALLPFGTTNDSPLTQALPAWAKHFKNAYPEFFGTSDQWREQMDIEMRQEWTDYLNGNGPDPRKDMDGIANRVRNRFFLRGVIGLGAPVTMTPSNELQMYLDQAHLYRAQYGDPQSNPAYQALLPQYEAKYGKDARGRLVIDHPEFKDWLTKFREDYPKYFDMAISISTNDSGLNATDAAVSAAKKYRSVIALHPEYGWMIAGEDNAFGLTPDKQFSQADYNYELATPGAPGSKTNLRNFEDPSSALEKAEVQKGWASYQIARTKLNIAMEQQGIKSLREARAKPLKEAWDGYVGQLESYNQYWGQAYLTRNTGKAVDMMNAALDAMGANKELAERPDMKVMAAYIQSRSIMQGILAQRGLGGLNTQANDDLGIAWDAYVQQLRQKNPAFEQMWIKGLEADDLSSEVRR
jgi:hypothetical protein